MKKKMNNKGFSLVELIIVIAIMAVLIGILAPQFIRYVERSRRSTDIQAAQSLQTAYLADVADGTITVDIGTPTAPVTIAAGNLPSTVTTVPTVAGNATGVTDFSVFVDVSAGTAQVFLGTFDVTTEAGVNGYNAAP